MDSGTPSETSLPGEPATSDEVKEGVDVRRGDLSDRSTLDTSLKGKTLPNALK
jgi:hypothetical protein